MEIPMVLPLVLVLGVTGVVVGTFIGWSRRRTIVIDPAARNVLVRLRRSSWSSVLLGVLIGAATATALLATVNVDLGRLASVAPAAGGVDGRAATVATAMLTAAGLLGLATIATVMASANRPRVGATSPETDTLLRRASTRQILLVSAAAAAGSLMPVAGLMAMLLLGLDCRPWWYVALGVVWAIVMVVSSGVAASRLGTALWGPRMVDRVEEPVVVR